MKKSDLDNKSEIIPLYKRSVLKELRKFRRTIIRKKFKDVKDKLFLKQVKFLYLILKNIDVTEYSKLKMYPIHRDLNPENLLWSKGDLIGIIDFDNVSEVKDPLLKDVGIVLQFMCVDKNHHLDIKKAKFFVKEYTKGVSLSKIELSLIPNILIAALIEDFSYAFWMLLNDPKRAKLKWLNENYEAAIWHYKNRDKIIKGMLR